MELKDNTILNNILFAKKCRLLRHFIIIIILIINLYPFNINQLYNTKILPNTLTTDLIYKLQLNAIVLIFTGYLIIVLNIYLFIPKILFRNKYIIYILTIIALGTIYYFIGLILSNFWFNDYKEYIDVLKFSIFEYIAFGTTPIIFVLATTGFKVFTKWVIGNKKFTELKNLQFKNELTHLKNQVNPHFLFNTLNNLNTLIKVDTETASNVVLGLSDVLRYQIYETDKSKVSFKKDFQMLENYLLLENIRRENFSYELVSEISNNNVEIPPLLFINYVENAIKYSIDNKAPSFCKIIFKSENGYLIFNCINSIPNNKVKSNEGGIGLINTKKRLELIYANNYELDFIEEANLYKVNLKIPL